MRTGAVVGLTEGEADLEQNHKANYCDESDDENDESDNENEESYHKRDLNDDNRCQTLTSSQTPPMLILPRRLTWRKLADKYLLSIIVFLSHIFWLPKQESVVSLSIFVAHIFLLLTAKLCSNQILVRFPNCHECV